MAFFEELKIPLENEQKRLIHNIYTEARNIFERGERNADPNAFVSRSLLKNSPLGSEQLYKLYIEQLLLITARDAEMGKNIVTYDSKEKFERMIIERIVAIISENLYSTLTLEEIAKALNYSRTYISLIFKKHKKNKLFLLKII